MFTSLSAQYMLPKWELSVDGGRLGARVKLDHMQVLSWENYDFTFISSLVLPLGNTLVDVGPFKLLCPICPCSPWPGQRLAVHESPGSGSPGAPSRDADGFLDSALDLQTQDICTQSHWSLQSTCEWGQQPMEFCTAVNKRYREHVYFLVWENLGKTEPRAGDLTCVFTETRRFPSC